MSQTPEQEIRRRLRLARREIVKAYERAADVDEQIGLRRGHLVEGARLCQEILDELDHAIEKWER